MMQEEEKQSGSTGETTEIEVEAGPEEEKVIPQLRACAFKVRGLEFSIPLEFLVEIVEIEDVFYLPLAPDYIAGMIHYRGRAVPLIDMGRLHDMQRKEGLKGHPAVITEYAGELIGFVSDELPRLTEDFQGEIIEIGDFFDTYRVR